MVLVEGGTFTMGAAENQLKEAESDEKTLHQVTLDGFYICKYEVTQDLWTYVMGKNPSHFKNARRPVENITWNDCQQFIDKLNALVDLRDELRVVLAKAACKGIAKEDALELVSQVYDEFCGRV